MCVYPIMLRESFMCEATCTGKQYTQPQTISEPLSCLFDQIAPKFYCSYCEDYGKCTWHTRQKTDKACQVRPLRIKGKRGIVKWFQVLAPYTENTLSPLRVLVTGTMRSFLTCALYSIHIVSILHSPEHIMNVTICYQTLTSIYLYMPQNSTTDPEGISGCKILCYRTCQCTYQIW